MVRKHVLGTKNSRPGLGYGEVTILRRPPKASEPRSTPRIKVDLQDEAKIYGKGYHIWAKSAQRLKPARVDFTKQRKKVDEFTKLDFKETKICWHCGSEGHLWNKCSARLSFKTEVQKPKGSKGGTSTRSSKKGTSWSNLKTKVHKPEGSRGGTSTRRNQIVTSNIDLNSLKSIASFSSNKPPKTAKLTWVRKN